MEKTTILRGGKNRIRNFAAATALMYTALFLILTAVPKAQAGLAVFPSRVEITTLHGETKEFELSAANSCDYAVESSLKPWDFARDEQGLPQPVKPQDVKKFYGCSSWLEFDKKPIEIKPNETGTFKLKVTVPNDADYGTHYAYVTIINKPIPPKNSKNGATMPVGFRISALILVSVGTPTNDSSIPQLKASASVRDFGINRYNFDQTINLRPRIKNSGNTHLILSKKSKIEIWNGKVKEASLVVPEYSLLPENTLVIPVEWKSDALIGKYKAKFYGYVDLDEPLTAEKTFWVISWKLVAATAAGIILLAVALKMFFKKFKIQLASKS